MSGPDERGVKKEPLDGGAGAPQLNIAAKEKKPEDFRGLGLYLDTKRATRKRTPHEREDVITT